MSFPERVNNNNPVPPLPPIRGVGPGNVVVIWPRGLSAIIMGLPHPQRAAPPPPVANQPREPVGVGHRDPLVGRVAPAQNFGPFVPARIVAVVRNAPPPPLVGRVGPPPPREPVARR